MSCGVGCGRGSGLALPWLWWRPAAVAMIRPLAWEPPHAASAALKRQKTKKQKTKTKKQRVSLAGLGTPGLFGSNSEVIDQCFLVCVVAVEKSSLTHVP